MVYRVRNANSNISFLVSYKHFLISLRYLKVVPISSDPLFRVWKTENRSAKSKHINITPNTYPTYFFHFILSKFSSSLQDPKFFTIKIRILNHRTYFLETSSNFTVGKTICTIFHHTNSYPHAKSKKIRTKTLLFSRKKVYLNYLQTFLKVLLN